MPAAGAFDEALKHYKQALEVSRKAFCGDGQTHPEVANVVSNIGLYHLRKSKQYLTAITSFKEALAVYLKCYEGRHPLVAHCKANLAIALEKHGQEAEALDLYCTGFLEHVHSDFRPDLYGRFRALVEKNPGCLQDILAKAAGTDKKKVR